MANQTMHCKHVASHKVNAPFSESYELMVMKFGMGGCAVVSWPGPVAVRNAREVFPLDLALEYQSIKVVDFDHLDQEWLGWHVSIDTSERLYALGRLRPLSCQGKSKQEVVQYDPG